MATFSDMRAAPTHSRVEATMECAAAMSNSIAAACSVLTADADEVGADAADDAVAADDDDDDDADRFTVTSPPLSVSAVKLRCARMIRRQAALAVSGSDCHTRAAPSSWASLMSPKRAVVSMAIDAQGSASSSGPCPAALPLPLPLPLSPTTLLTDRHSVEAVDDADGE
jgi:hypothetical protein